MHPSGSTILGFCAVLALLAAIAVLSLQRISGRADHRDVWLKFGAQLVLTAAVLVTAWLGTFAFSVFVGFVFLVGSYELWSVLHARARLRDRALKLFVTLSALAVGCLALQRIASLGFVHLFFFYVVIELNDTFAAIVGRYLGRTPLVPKLSPRKTREGFLAGLCASTLAGFALAFLEPRISPLLAALLALVLAACGVATDLLASALKRHAGVKDFSRLVPGHGGVLDAYDSLLLVAPAFYAMLHVVL